jgi:DNA mismatch repair protein MSH5
MEAAEGPVSDQETEFHNLNESILAIDVRDRSTLGCSIFSTENGVLKIATDISMAGEDVAEQFLSYAQPTTILVSRRTPEPMLSFVEKHVEKSARGEYFPVHSVTCLAVHFFLTCKPELTLRLVSPSDFSHTFACEELSSLNITEVHSFQTTPPPNIERQHVENNIQAVQNHGHQEPQCMKLIRCSSIIDLDNVASVSNQPFSRKSMDVYSDE